MTDVEIVARALEHVLIPPLARSPFVLPNTVRDRIAAAVVAALTEAGRLVPDGCVACSACGGTGRVPIEDFFATHATCDICHGSGRVDAGQLVPEGGPGVYVVRDLAPNPWWREFFQAVLRLCDVAPQSLDEDFVRRAIGDLDAEPR